MTYRTCPELIVAGTKHQTKAAVERNEWLVPNTKQITDRFTSAGTKSVVRREG
ncbi:hypothetical protein DsansV1_C71g0269241 [Dioscorea sansibarensis]